MSTSVFKLPTEGGPIRTERDAVDVIGAVAHHRPEIIVIPTGRLADDFFQLRTGVAGAVIQKFLTYGFRLVILGDISAHVAKSSALRDFVYECNSGRHIWFVANSEELKERLERSL
jgi:Domain of unknown function (DUF4180)